MKKKPRAKKKATPRKAVAKKTAARKAPKKRATPPKARKLRLVVPQPKSTPQPRPVVVGLVPPPQRPGVHLPMKPPPAYAQMIQREWAHKPPPHKLTK